jgi:hypothetical protein
MKLNFSNLELTRLDPDVEEYLMSYNLNADFKSPTDSSYNSKKVTSIEKHNSNTTTSTQCSSRSSLTDENTPTPQNKESLPKSKAQDPVEVIVEKIPENEAPALLKAEKTEDNGHYTPLKNSLAHLLFKNPQKNKKEAEPNLDRGCCHIF